MRRSIAVLLFCAAVAQAETLEEAVRGYVRAAEAEAEETGPWTITGSFGLTFTDGNSDTLTVAAGADGIREWDPWKLILKLRAIYSESEDVESANEEIFIERLERALSERSWIFQEFLAEHDEQEDLNYRLQLTVGYRRQLVKKERFNLFGEIGAGVLYEKFRTMSETEAIAHLGIAFDWKITDNLLFTQVFTVYPSLSNGGEYRFISESVFTSPLSEKLDLRLAIIDKYDSDPVAGVEKNDIQIILALVINFTGKKKEA
jgi:putative salt-induced outer membrane protein YdiY